VKVGVNEYVGYDQAECRQERGPFRFEEEPGAKKNGGERREISPVHRRAGEDKKQPVK